MSGNTHSFTPQLTPRQYLGLHLLIGLIVCAVSLWLFCTLVSGILTNGALVQFDQNLATVLHSWATPAGTVFFGFVTFLGFQFLWVVAVLGALFFARRRMRAHLVTWSIAWIGGELLNQILKQFFARPRPIFADPIWSAANFSFPSGHAMFSFIMYGLLAYFAILGLHTHRTRLAVILSAIFLIALIGFSRLYLGVHYFSDVIGAFAAGALWLSVCITGMDVYRSRKQLSTHPILDKPIGTSM